MNITKAYSSFSVTDIPKAKQFYSETLGLNATEDPKMGGVLTLNVNGHTVMIYPKSDHIPATFTVLNIIVENVETAVDELTAKGIKFEMYDNEWIKTDSKGISKDGPIIAWFKDPFGNFISLIEE
jgi:predicted enzyme related to lactoylglutathione lyase